MPPKSRLNVHSFPRPPLLEEASRHLQVKWHGHVNADTKDAYWVLKTTHPPSRTPLFWITLVSEATLHLAALKTNTDVLEGILSSSLRTHHFPYPFLV